MSCPIHRLIYFQRFHRYSPGPSRTNAPFVRVLARSLMFSRVTITTIVDARSDAFYPARSNGPRFPVAIVGYGFPFDFGTSRSVKFHGRKFFLRTAPDTGINLNGLKSIGVTGLGDGFEALTKNRTERFARRGRDGTTRAIDQGRDNGGDAGGP